MPSVRVRAVVVPATVINEETRVGFVEIVRWKEVRKLAKKIFGRRACQAEGEQLEQRPWGRSEPSVFGRPCCSVARMT